MRDLSLLSEQGIPIESERGRGGGVRLQHQWGLEKLNLSYQEIIHLLVALSVVEHFPFPLIENIQNIKDKIARSFPKDQRQKIQQLRDRIYIGNKASPQVYATYTAPSNKQINILYGAFLNTHQVEITYTSNKQETTQRKIDIHCLLFNWPVWYLLAWDHYRNGMRVFRTDRVQTCKPLATTYQPGIAADYEAQIEEYFKNL
jgi:predicted DNA-binding transcriptional regulator YafY